MSIIIPTLNSSRYIDIILSFYRRHEVPVIVFVDDRSVDDTLSIVRRCVDDIRLIHNPGTVVEDLVPLMAKACGTKWVLRIDDDELPSLALLRFVEEVVEQDAIAVYGFPRYQCAVSRDGRLMTHREISPIMCRQWRLFQPGQVHFRGSLHSSGLQHENQRDVAAPDLASHVHLDWAVHSSRERAQKLARYDAHTQNEGTKWRDFYLYEEGVTADAFVELALPEFDETVREIAERLGELCVETEKTG